MIFVFDFKLNKDLNNGMAYVADSIAGADDSIFSEGLEKS